MTDRIFTPEQLQNLNAIVWLYRGEQERYLKLINDYLNQVCTEAATVPAQLETFEDTLQILSGTLNSYMGSLPKEAEGRAEAAAELQEWQQALSKYKQDRQALLQELASYRENWCPNVLQSNDWQQQVRQTFEPLATKARALSKQLDSLYKIANRSLESTLALSKKLNLPIPTDKATGSPAQQRKALDEQRQQASEQLKLMTYFYKQVIWLQTRFPEAELRDVEGLVKLISIAEIEANDWSLTPGRYVGASPQEVDEDFDFEEALRDIHEELTDLNKEAAELAQTIQKNFEELGI
jgi:type I restriction enzyme M protein